MKVEISAGHSRKVNLANYGGPQYESEDCWTSLKREIEVYQNASTSVDEQIRKATKELDTLAQNLNDEIVNTRIKVMSK